MLGLFQGFGLEEFLLGNLKFGFECLDGGNQFGDFLVRFKFWSMFE